MESLTSSPVASAAANGYHLPPMDARAWMVRLVVGVGLALALAMPAAAQTPTPTPTPAGAPKILLAFDASGSMLTDDGAGTRKIDAAKDAAVALLDSLPDSTEIGLRVYGGTLPSRPIGPACRDSKLVMPIGPRGRNKAELEQQIRSFRARGRTPIAYALEQAATDLGDSGARTIVLVSDGKDTCQPPSPCSVAQRVAKGGVEMRIQAIGFNVDPEAREELQCIASRGRRRLPRRDRRREPARGAAGPLHAGAARVPAQGQGDQGRPRRAPRHAAHPRPVHRPAAARLRALVRDRAQARRDAEGQPVVHPARPRRREQRRRNRRWTSSRPTSTSPPPRTRRPATTRCSPAAGYVGGRRRRLAPDRRRRAGRRRQAVQQARPLLPQARARGQLGEGALQRHRRAAVHVGDAGRDPRPRSRREGPAGTAGPGAARGHDHARGAAEHGPAGAGRRRAGRARFRRRRACSCGGGGHEGRDHGRRAAAGVPGARAGAGRHAGRRRRLVQHRAAAQARALCRHGRRRRDRVLEGRDRQGPDPASPGDGRHVRDRDRLLRERLPARASTTSTTSSTSGARCASRSATSTTGAMRRPSSRATTRPA